MSVFCRAGQVVSKKKLVTGKNGLKASVKLLVLVSCLDR